MGLVEAADRFSAKTPRQKLLIVGALFGALILLFVFAFYLGKVKGRQWADSDYLEEREKTAAEVAEHKRRAEAEFNAAAKRHEARELQLSAENEFLRRQNEATAEVLKKNDGTLRGDASKFADLLKARQEKIAEVDADQNFDSQICGLCDDAAKSGFPLSATFCARCTKGK